MNQWLIIDPLGYCTDQLQTRCFFHLERLEVPKNICGNGELYTAICRAQLCIKNKGTSLVSNQSPWNIDEPVADNRPLGLLINLRNKLYHL